MPISDPGIGVRLLAAVLLASSHACAAAGPTTGRLDIEADAGDLRISLDGPSLDLVGFDHPPRTTEERETLALAEENLRAGDAMVRLPAGAGCRLLEARVDSDPVPEQGSDEGRLGASYRFNCDHQEALDALAVGIFAGFPFLVRLHARYRVGTIRGEGVLTPANPVLVLIPLLGDPAPH